MNRKQQQADLIYQLGLLLAPLEAIIAHPDQHDTQSRARACAKYTNDMPRFFATLNDFVTGETGHNYQIEHNRVCAACHDLRIQLGDIRDNDTRLLGEVSNCKAKALTGILTVPADDTSLVLEAHSPFQAYCTLKSYFELSRHRVTWADPYMGAGLFHRYLNDLSNDVQVTLITSQRANSPDYVGFLDVSRLYAQERGPSKYRLIVERTNHDRWLRCDDCLYHLGGSAKDAGQRSPFTVSLLDNAPDTLAKLEDLIASGTELFGPTNIVHP